MKLRVLLAAIAGTLVFAGSAAAHSTEGTFGVGLGAGWLDFDDAKIRGLMSAEAPASAKPSGASVRCVRGMAAEFPCKDVDLLGHLPLARIGGGEIGNDMWGWKDPATGREYALVGKTNGTAFVDVTEPTRPVYLGQMPTEHHRRDLLA